MDEVHGEHEPIRFRRPSKRQRALFFASTVLAISVVFVGWYAIVFRDIQGNVADTKAQLSDGLSAAAQIREETQVSRDTLEETSSEIKAMFDPFSESLQRQEAMMDIVAEGLILEISEPPEGDPEPAAHTPTE